MSILGASFDGVMLTGFYSGRVHGKISTCTNTAPRPQLGSLPAEHIPHERRFAIAMHRRHPHPQHLIRAVCSTINRCGVVLKQYTVQIIPLTNDLCIDIPEHSMKAHLTINNLNRRSSSNHGVLRSSTVSPCSGYMSPARNHQPGPAAPRAFANLLRLLQVLNDLRQRCCWDY